MGTVGGSRWERLVLVVVLALGVLAMHTVPALDTLGSAHDSMSMSAPGTSGAAGPADVQAAPGPVRPGGDHPEDGPGSALHHVLAVCVAILGGAALLIAAVAVCGAPRRRAPRHSIGRGGTDGGYRRSSPATGARGPAGTALRAAELIGSGISRSDHRSHIQRYTRT